MSRALQDLKIRHIKAKADASFADGNLRDAISLYTEAMDLCNDRFALDEDIYTINDIITGP